jgi:hypothetical protein
LIKTGFDEAIANAKQADVVVMVLENTVCNLKVEVEQILIYQVYSKNY